ncbi:hypothetical protein AXG93_2772s1240 [Marchantia polymorpha subsp. ruderalis]|uniref:Uncharacterized protein n=1 Tax=Marchantia polymorpha subsp. ruderalis TaxID=1480154 RepID=A0A176WGJ7_MARPO|nr:hypothetical protein AXG93_2772s1240 [Marchantia polymorpha subsp. ruderalis]
MKQRNRWSNEEEDIVIEISGSPESLKAAEAFSGMLPTRTKLLPTGRDPSSRFRADFVDGHTPDHRGEVAKQSFGLEAGAVAQHTPKSILRPRPWTF